MRVSRGVPAHERFPLALSYLARLQIESPRQFNLVLRFVGLMVGLAIRATHRERAWCDSNETTADATNTRRAHIRRDCAAHLIAKACPA
jgi:hypothetical protein